MDVSLAEIESGLASYTNLVSGASSTNFTTDWSQLGLESITNISSGGPDGEDVTRLELSAYNISSGTYNNGASYTDKNNAGVYYYGVGTNGLSNDPTTSMYLIVRSTPGYGTQQIHLQHGRFGYLGNGPHTITEEWGLISDTDTSTGHSAGNKRWFGIGPVENEHIYIDVVKIWVFEDTVSYTLPLLPPNITLDLATNTITSNVDFEIKYTPIDLSLSELTKDTTINPVRSQTIPFVKSNGNQEERSVTLHGDATYNRFANEYYFPGDLSGYASIEGQLFGEHAMSMSFMYKSGGEQPVLETINNDGEIKHFSTNGTLTLTEDATVDILIVGGGGAGGNALGGGGGAGGVVYTVNQTMTAGTYNIFVGAGGQGQDYSAGSVESNNGEDSYISDSNGSIITMDMG